MFLPLLPPSSILCLLQMILPARLSLFLGLGAAVHAQTSYITGLGIADITGPVVETNMMGYASLGQTDSGLHMRQFSRAFIISSSTSTSSLSPSNTILLVNSDIAMGDNGVRRSIVQAISNDPVLSKFYTDQNFALVGTHQHSGVGGYLENLLPQLTSLGFVNQTARAIVDGTMTAIRRAHASLSTTTFSLSNATLLDTNLNRSPTAYLANPASERALYTSDVEKEFTFLKFNDGRGFMSWFPVHGTSIYENNTLVSSDNKGYAAFLSELMHNPNAQPGNNTFVAGFIQANVGDTTPNTLGAFCESPGESFDGQPCEAEHSTCGGTTEQCHGRGPAFNQDNTGMASSAIIGTNQHNAAESLFSAASPNLGSISGNVRSVHVFVNMSSYSFTLANGSAATTCPPAMGFSFAGGTTDGPGAFDFVQGDNSTSQNPLWEIVKSFITPIPTAQQTACQAPKPILLNTGFAHSPYDWSPSIVNVQLLRVGNLVVIVMPGELTTMAGRRLKNTVLNAVNSLGIKNAKVVIAGPSNTYGHYVTTREEYSVQRYEGASTLYGPATLEAYQDIFAKLVPWLADTAPSSAPPFSSTLSPPDQSGSFISLQTPVIQDSPPFFKSFGQISTDVNTATAYTAGQTVNVSFVGANPRNNLRLGGTFLTVERLVNGVFQVVKTDAWPSTLYRWVRDSTILGTSTVTISWTIESGTPAGNYRIRYFGDSKALIGGGITPFVGSSSLFSVA